MKKLVLSSLAIIMFFINIFTVNATHIVGGDISYKCLGNNEYEVTLTVRRDCYNGSEEAAFDDPALIGIYGAKTHQFLKGYGEKGYGYISIPLSFNDTLNETITSECGFFGNQVCVETTTYRKTVTLPFLEEGFILAYQRCCRNISINNIVDPLETGSAYYTEITKFSQQECNSSPTFNNWASVYICQDQPLSFDQSATDLDGDSLVYSLCMPHSTLTADNPTINSEADFRNFGPPFDQVQYSNPYSLDDMLGGNPLVIDAQSGLLTAIPNLVGQYLIGVCVEEYRDGVLIGKTWRDFQYNVRVCLDPPIIDFEYSDVECGGLEIAFDNTSEGLNTYEWFFDYPSTHLDSISTDSMPSFIYGNGGTYQVKLIGTRDSDFCSLTVIKEIIVAGNGVIADFEASVIDCTEDGINVHIVDTSVSTSDYNREWTITQGGDIITSQDSIIDIKLLNEEDLIIQLIVGVGSCMDTLVKTYTIEELVPTVAADFEVLECFGDSLIVKINANFTVPDTSVHLLSNTWEVITSASGNYNLSDTTMFVLTILNSDSITVNINAIADNGCDIEYSADFNPNQLEVKLLIDDLYVLCLGDSIRIIANPDISWTYTWIPTDGLTFDPPGDFSNPWAKPLETTTYKVIVTDGICIDSAEVTIMVQTGADITIHGDTLLCDTSLIELWVISDFNIEWSKDIDFSTIIYEGDTLKTNMTNDEQTYYARIKNGEACMDEVVSRTVKRVESPILDFTWTFECGTFEICFESTSGLSDELTSWDFGDLTTTSDTASGNSVCYIYPTSGVYDVTISDLSDFCSGDDVTISITVPDSLNITVEQEMYEICEGETIIINTTTTSNGTISYCDADGNEIGNGSPWEFQPTESTKITAKVSDENGCQVTKEIMVIVNDFSSDLELEISPEVTGYAGQEYVITVVGGLDGYTYLWTTGDTTQSITVSPNETIQYCVTVTDENGCEQELCETITIDVPVLCNEEDVYLPTAFSPNGDGNNDVFLVRSNVITSMQLIIYDRWGEKLFSTNILKTGWDGTYKGVTLSPDVYAYYFEAKCSNQDEFKKVGNVSLLK